jgi:sortase A
LREHKKIPWTVWVMGGIFALSFLLLSYSIIKLLLIDLKVEQSLKKWETNSLVTRELAENQSKKNPEISTLLYQNRPNKGEIFGKLTIPKLKIELPIIEGTDNEQLNKGVGHYTGSVLPGETDNAVLAGHRDSVFKDLGELTIGDKVRIETNAGSFVYEIFNKQIVDKDDRTIIVPNNRAILTLVTCYPFNYIGPAPKRYVLTARYIN